MIVRPGAPIPRPRHVPRYTPEGTVPLSGGEPDWSAEWVRARPRRPMRSRIPLRRRPAQCPPRPGTSGIPRDIDAAGDTLYQNFCSVCHGPAGNAERTGRPANRAPSLLTARARGYTDGYIYSIIRYGRGVMPRYGDKVYAPVDRWAIVNHVRKLQRQSPAPPAAPGAAHRSAGPSATGSTGAAP